MAVAYSDAESTGNIASVIITRGTVSYAMAKIPNAIKRKLKPRKTNIMAYELIAAVMTIILLEELVDTRIAIRHFVDNKPARSVLLKGASKQLDLNDIAGMIWYAAAHRTQSYWSHWVRSEANLADRPSRGDISIMMQLNGREVKYNFNSYLQAVESWMLQPHKVILVTR